LQKITTAPKTMPPSRKRIHKPTVDTNVPSKANHVLSMIFLVMVFIIIRVWYLSVVQHDARLQKAQKPQRRVVIERAERATIRDRFNIPLAINKVQYNATVSYSQLREVPRIERTKNNDGTFRKKFSRKEHIEKLSKLLAFELELDADRVEDLIYSKAAPLPNIPFTIKEDITEQQYFRLKMFEKDWVGLQAERMPKRYYPQGRVASDVVGYMGAINYQEYRTIVAEITDLRYYVREHENGNNPELPDDMISSNKARKRLRELEERAYTINDYVGKSGIEASYDEQLHGFRGKKTFVSDAQGNFLNELPGSREPLSGQRILLSLSSELQEYAEQLLAQNEQIREGHSIHLDFAKKSYLSLKQPWIKGGAIVAMDPKSGEVLALASYPRYDPNDFIPCGDPSAANERKYRVRRWLENDYHLADLWDRKQSLKREMFSAETGEFYDESVDLSWEAFLGLILLDDHPVIKALQDIWTVGNAIAMQRGMEDLMTISGHDNARDILNIVYNSPPHITHNNNLSVAQKEQIKLRLSEYKQEVTRIIQLFDIFFTNTPNNYDKLLTLDLCRLAVRDDHFSSELSDTIGKQSLSTYRNASTAITTISHVVYKMTKELYHEMHFKAWLNNNKTSFLREKRLEEKAAGRYHKPYTDILDSVEDNMFQNFWEEHRWTFITTFILGTPLPAQQDEELTSYIHHFLTWHHELKKGAHSAAPWHRHYSSLSRYITGLDPDIAAQYLATMRCYRELTRPLWGKYSLLRRDNDGRQSEKHLAAAFYPVYGFGYGRSHAFRHATPQGSIFKIVTAYAALAQQYQKIAPNYSMKALNPLVITDYPHRQKGSKQKWNIGYTSHGEPIAQYYNGGRLPRSARRNIGKIDILSAIETSSNPYFSMLAGDMLEDPEDLNEAARMLSFGERTGIDLPGEISGNLPTDLKKNRTGLYASAIGQHTIVVTPLQTAVMMSAISNSGKVLKPKIVKLMAGKEPVRGNEQIFYSDKFAYKDSLALAGIDFPLFTAALARQQKNLVRYFPTEIKRRIFLPDLVRSTLLEGMKRVILSPQGCANISRIKNYHDNLDATRALSELKHQIVGKTSTAEKIENVCLDISTGSYIYKHTWFTGISFNSEPYSEEQSTVILDEFGNPELVVVVFLRFGDFGREAAPPAAQMIKKWREIKKRHEKEII